MKRMTTREDLASGAGEAASHTCCGGNVSTGPGYATPLDAMANAPRERFIFVLCPNVAEPRKPDALATVDVDPESSSYSKVSSLSAQREKNSRRTILSIMHLGGSDVGVSPRRR